MQPARAGLTLSDAERRGRNPRPDYFVPPGVLCRIIFCPGALNELPGAVADVRLFSICCPGAELRLCTPVDLGAALASETLSASDRPAMIEAALYMMSSFQFRRTNEVALRRFPVHAVYGGSPPRTYVTVSAQAFGYTALASRPPLTSRSGKPPSRPARSSALWYRGSHPPAPPEYPATAPRGPRACRPRCCRARSPRPGCAHC
jgi:hypothetical protein